MAAMLPALGEIKPVVRSSVSDAVYQTLRNKLMHGE